MAIHHGLTKRRKFVGLGIANLVVILLFAGASRSSTSSLAASAEPTEPSQAMFCGDREVPDVAVDELEASVPVHRVEAIGTELFGARYGGMYFHRAICPPVARVMIKDGTSDDFAKLENALSDDSSVDASRVEPVSVAFTSQEVEEGAEAAAEELAALEIDSSDPATQPCCVV